MSFTLKATSQSTVEIKKVFEEFQQGYSQRDTSKARSFAYELCADDIQIIGTGNDEWLFGIRAAESLFRNDWLYWFGLSIDTSTLKLKTHGNTTFFILKGTASISFPNKDAAYDFAYNRLQQLITSENTNKTKLLSYSSEASNLIQQIESGGLDINYAIRISGGLVNQNGKWKFQQLVFSFPYPMTRK